MVATCLFIVNNVFKNADKRSSADAQSDQQHHVVFTVILRRGTVRTVDVYFGEPVKFIQNRSRFSTLQIPVASAFYRYPTFQKYTGELACNPW